MAFVLSPLKQYRSGETNHTKCSLQTLCLHERQVTLDTANFRSGFTVVFNVFGRERGAGVNYLGPYYTKGWEFKK